MKKFLTIIPLVILLCFAFSFQQQAEGAKPTVDIEADVEAMAELEAMKAQAEIEEQNKGLVKRMYETWGKGDFEAFKEVVAPEYVWYQPSRSTKPYSLEEKIEFGKMFHNAFPDRTFSIEELIAVEDIVISRFIFSGTHEGEFMGIPATGNKTEFSGIMITRIENGKIVEDKEEVDLLGLMQQLGMELKPKEAEK